MSKKLLDGVKVVELATFIAAPAASRFLADLGADVIKIEAPRGDQLRYTAHSEGRPLNQRENTTFDLENANKRGIALNLRDDKAKEVLFKLLDKSDIFITNWRPDALKRAGLDYDVLHERYPALVYASVTGYGDDGPDKDLPGFDFTAYFARGGYLGTLYPQGSEPMMVVPGLGDHNVGMNLAAGILAALYSAKQTGQGEMVSSSLFQSAVYNMGIMIQASQYPETGKPYPIDKRESSNPMNNAWLTKDGRYIQTCMPVYDMYYDALMKAFDREDMIGNEKFFPNANLIENNAMGEMYDFISENFATKTVDEWKEILMALDIPFGVAQLWEEIIEDKQAWANNFFYEMAYDNGSKKALVRPPVNFKEMGLAEYKRGPLLGEDGEEILEELGYSADDIQSMKEEKIMVVYED